MYTYEDTNLFLFDWAMPVRLNNGNVDCSDIVIDPGLTSESQQLTICDNFCNRPGGMFDIIASILYSIKMVQLLKLPLHKSDIYVIEWKREERSWRIIVRDEKKKKF